MQSQRRRTAIEARKPAYVDYCPWTRESADESVMALVLWKVLQLPKFVSVGDRAPWVWEEAEKQSQAAVRWPEAAGQRPVVLRPPRPRTWPALLAQTLQLGAWLESLLRVQALDDLRSAHDFCQAGS